MNFQQIKKLYDFSYLVLFSYRLFLKKIQELFYDN